MATSAPVVEEFGGRLSALGWVSDLLVAGSLAMGDYVPRISDLDLVALVDGSVDMTRQATLRTVHRHLDEGTGSGLSVGCVYVDSTKVSDVRWSTRRGLTDHSSIAFSRESLGPSLCAMGTPFSAARRARCF